MDNIKPILQHRPGEVMVNFMYDFINRFINHPGPVNEQSLDSFFGTTDWRHVRGATDRENASVNLYKEQLRITGGYDFATYTRVLKPLHDRAYFATRNAKGVVKFRDVEKQTMREQDTVRASAQRTNRETRTGQTEFGFGLTHEFSETIQLERANRLNEAKERLFGLVAQGPIPYEKLQPLVLEIPLVSNADLVKILIDGQNQGEGGPCNPAQALTNQEYVMKSYASFRRGKRK